MHGPGTSRQVDRALAGRIAPAHDDHVGALAHLRLHRGRAVVDAASLVAIAVGDLQPLIPRPRGDHHRTAPHATAVGQLDRIGLAFRLEAAGVDRVGHPRAELLGLGDGPLGQLLARDPGRESQVVLDLGAGPRLAAGRAAIDGHHAQPFRGRVHRRRQSRRSRAHDHDVAHLVFLDAVEAEVAGEAFDGRVSRHPALAADDDRRRVDAHVEALQECRGPLILLEVEERMRLVVAGEELADLVRPAGVARADDLRGPVTAGDQGRAAHQERAEEQVGELRVLDDDPLEPLRRDPQDLRVLVGPGLDDRGAAQRVEGSPRNCPGPWVTTCRIPPSPSPSWQISTMPRGPRRSRCCGPPRRRGWSPGRSSPSCRSARVGRSAPA